MAETTTIPILHDSPHPSLKPQARKKSNAQPHRPRSRDAPRPLQSNGIVKKKQSKSRNGCVTCKTKRLKCDEVKPTCEQCKRRNVACEGYKKEFKWRPFEEPSCIGKRPTKARKDSSSSTAQTAQPCNSYKSNFHNQCYHHTDTVLNFPYAPPCSTISGMYDQLPVASVSQAPFAPASSTYATPTLSPYIGTPQSTSPIDVYTPSFQESRSLHKDDFIPAEESEVTAPSSVTVEHSPRLPDLTLSGKVYYALLEGHLPYHNQHGATYQTTDCAPSHEPKENDEERMSRDLDYNLESWSLQYLSPTAPSRRNFSTGPQNHSVLARSQQAVTLPEIIPKSFRYDRYGLSSVKDGLRENPWRILIWPLARECSALYHAIASMTYFHQSSQFPPMRAQGIKHMRTAVEALEEGIHGMRFDAAIATTLVLAFAESWDVHISTGINHIKGAKVLIKQALMQHCHVPKRGKEWKRLRFLCNTWTYMDVVARLTSADDDGESDDIDAIYYDIHSTDHTEISLDPLMGFARSLLLIIGRVATLIQKVRETNRDSSDLIAQAIDLKSQLEKWTPPPYAEESEDETTNPKDSIRTATAFQYATLLYLHQSFPGIPSPSALVLAKRTLCELAAVESSSRSCIIHVYPLMAAGCEMVEEEDRAWVLQRWELLLSRTNLGIMRKALTVTKELWARRDAYTEQGRIFEARRNPVIPPIRPLKRNFDGYSGQKDADEDEEWCWLGSRPNRIVFGSFLQPSTAVAHLFEQQTQEDDITLKEDTELLDPEYTVKGRLHWLSVMQDWDREVLLD